MLKVKEIDDFSQFVALRDQWNQVLSKSEDNNIFLTWEWLSTWWRHFGKGRKLRILLAQENETIIAAAPLMLSSYSLFGLKLRKMEFLGAEHTDYRNFILTRQKKECMRLFMNYLQGLDWDFLEFRDIPEIHEPAASLRKLFYKGLLENERVSSTCYYIPLGPSINDFSKQISGDMRRNLRRRMKRLQENHTIIFERQDDVDSIDQGIKTFVNLHQKKWTSKGREGSFGEDPRFAGFLLDACKLLAEKRWVNLSLMKANDVPISAGLCFEYNKTLYYYHPGYDPAYAKFGVGNLLLLHLIESAIQNRLTMFDFLHGTEPYKRSWTSLSFNNLEFGCTRNRLLPVLYDKVIHSESYDWAKNSNDERLRKVKLTARRIFPSLYTALS